MSPSVPKTHHHIHFTPNNHLHISSATEPQISHYYHNSHDANSNDSINQQHNNSHEKTLYPCQLVALYSSHHSFDLFYVEEILMDEEEGNGTLFCHEQHSAPGLPVAPEEESHDGNPISSSSITKTRHNRTLLRSVTLKGRYARRFTELYATKRETDECRVFLDSHQVEISLEQVIDVAPIVLLRNAHYFNQNIRPHFRLVFYALEQVDIGEEYGRMPSSEFADTVQEMTEIQQQKENDRMLQSFKGIPSEETPEKQPCEDEDDDHYNAEVTLIRKQIPLPNHLLRANAEYWKLHKDILASHFAKEKLLSKDGMPLIGMDLYAGCGGLTLGLDSKGVITKWAVEWEKMPAKTFRKFFPDTHVFNMDATHFYHILSDVCAVHEFIHRREHQSSPSSRQYSTIDRISQIRAKREVATYKRLSDGTFSSKPSSVKSLRDNEACEKDSPNTKTEIRHFLHFQVVSGQGKKWVRWSELTKKYGPPSHLRQLLKESIRDEKIFPKYYNLPAPGEVDVLYGGPPCQGFSRANSSATGGDTSTKNLQYVLFCKFAKLLQPTYLLGENVEGILQQKNISLFEEQILKRIRSYNYEIRLGLLNAQGYGAPQSRFRTIMMATRKYANKLAPLLPPEGRYSCTSRSWTIKVPEFRDCVTSFTANGMGQNPSWLTYRTTWSSLSDLPAFHSFERAEKDKNCIRRYVSSPQCTFQAEMRSSEHYRNPHAVVDMHESAPVGPRARMFALAVPFGNNRAWDSMPRYIQRALSTNVRAYGGKCLNRGSFDVPRRTVLTRVSSYSDLTPDQHRMWSIRENARAQCFPDHFSFEGKISDVYRQIGNAVPSHLGAAIGESLGDAHTKWCCHLSRDDPDDRAFIVECSGEGMTKSRKTIEGMIEQILNVSCGIRKVYNDSMLPKLRSNNPQDIPEDYRKNTIANEQLLVRKTPAAAYTKFPLYLISQDDNNLEYPYIVYKKQKQHQESKKRKRQAQDALFLQKKRHAKNGGKRHHIVVNDEYVENLETFDPVFDLDKHVECIDDDNTLI